MEDPALLCPGCSAIAPTHYVGQFSPRRVRHLGAHRYLRSSGAASWQVQSPVTFMLTQHEGCATEQTIHVDVNMDI
jgi:hypothetical protein